MAALNVLPAGLQGVACAGAEEGDEEDSELADCLPPWAPADDESEVSMEGSEAEENQLGEEEEVEVGLLGLLLGQARCI